MSKPTASSSSSSCPTSSLKCTYCQNNLGNVSIKCSECINFYLCLKCFSMSAELGEHKKDHNYYLKSSISFPLFDSENFWTYKEEQLLLQFIEQYGFGNWDDISKQLPNRTSEECMKHYFSYYVYGNLGKYTLNTNLKQEDSNEGLNQKQLKLKQKHEIKQEVEEKSCLFSESQTKLDQIQTTVLLPPIEMSPEEQRALGYMPLRDDFEREYKNDAEQLISNLAVTNNQLVFLDQKSNINIPEPNEDEIDFDLKLTLIKIYRECLIERQRFKKIAREYGLINNASALINNHNKNLNNPTSIIISDVSVQTPTIGRPRKNKNINISNDKDISELNDKFKKYAQLISASDYESLLENLRKQRNLNERIAELQNYRSVGITKLNEIEDYNRQKLQKQKIKLELKQYKKHTKRMLLSASPNKRLTRMNSLKSPEKINSSLYQQSPSKRFKLDMKNESLNEDKTLTNSNSALDENDILTDDLNESENLQDLEDNMSDDLYDQEKSEDEKEPENESDGDDLEEDLSSAGAASSGGSAVNEVNTNNIVRRLRRLTSRSAHNNSFSLTKANKLNKKCKLNSSLNSSKHNKKLRSAHQEDESNQSDDDADSSSQDDDTESTCSNLTSNSSNSKLKTNLKKKENLKNFNSKNGRRLSERLCSMPGYNLLSENEKKLISSIHMKPNDYINFKTLLIKNSLSYRNDPVSVSTTTTTTSTNNNNNNNNQESLNTPEKTKSSLINYLKSTCPSYFEIAKSTRKKILRFLCDNGWIDIS